MGEDFDDSDSKESPDEEGAESNKGEKKIFGTNVVNVLLGVKGKYLQENILR